MSDELTPTERNALKWALFRTAYDTITKDANSDAQSKWFELKRLMGVLSGGE